MRDQWIEKLVCPNCRKTGNAELSQTDELSWDVRADSVPDGFNVIQVEHMLLATSPRNHDDASQTLPGDSVDCQRRWGTGRRKVVHLIATIAEPRRPAFVCPLLLSPPGCAW
jgi:hypothetical protein